MNFLSLLLCTLLVFAFPLTLCAQSQTQPTLYAQSDDQPIKPTTTPKQPAKGTTFTDGEMAGDISAEENYSGSGWFAGGLAGGFCLGLIGGGIMVGLSQGYKTPPTDAILMAQNKGNDYRAGFMEGYNRAAKSSALTNSIAGGAIGTVLIVTIILSTRSK